MIYLFVLANNVIVGEPTEMHELIYCNVGGDELYFNKYLAYSYNSKTSTVYVGIHYKML